MPNQKPIHVKTISEYHHLNGLPKPEHPLISIINYADLKNLSDEKSTTFIFDYYSISLKRGVNKLFYGQQEYDFDEGVLYFMAPNQILKVNNSNPNDMAKRLGWLLLIHPDFLWGTSLAKSIKKYDFFDYSVNEALFLSDKEEDILNKIIENIQREYQSNIDSFSQNIIISQIETLLNYSERFYQRQFIIRKINNHQVLEQFEKVLNTYFETENLTEKGLPTVSHFASELNISTNYLSAVLKTLTGQSTQQHIHNKLIEKAKEKLSITNLTVSEIAYELGFEHSQSFSKLFKNKTNETPLEFRKSFN